MLDLDLRLAILRLHEQGHGKREIARAVGVSRNAVRRVLKSKQAEVPSYDRIEQLTPELEHVRELHAACAGNLVRVVEELEAGGMTIAYSTLTGFCRRHGIGVSPKKRVGQYHFEPGEEMQHDTSPHVVLIDATRRKLQCASLVLCYSRMIHAQVFLRWNRLECRGFLSDAIESFGGAAGRCMLDNSSVVIASGTGKNAVPAPAMQALSKRFGYEFRAHELGDANRSARVERPFHYIENNFYPGRTFKSLDDLNEQLLAWCDRVNRRTKRHLRAAPLELFALEQPHLRPLPLHVPEIYDVHSRRVDTEGYVSLHANRYSVPTPLIGRRVEVRESRDRIRIFDGHQLVAEHSRLEAGKGGRRTLTEHGCAERRKKNPPPLPEEKTLRAVSPELSSLVDALRRRHGGRAVKAMRQLHRMYLDYPTEALVQAVRAALEYGLCDLHRLERMVLKRIAGDYFRLPIDSPQSPESDDDRRP